MPAARPYQKTLLHLRDSATVDFGPAGQPLTNNGVTVANDELTFDGSSHIDIGTPLADHNAQDFTVAFWFRTSVGGNRVLYQEQPDNTSIQNGIMLRTGTTGSLQFFHNADASSSYSSLIGSTNVLDGVWHKVVVTKIGSAVTMYLDNDVEVLTGTADSNGFSWTSVDTGAVGRDSRSSNLNSYANADVADLRVLGYGITAGEVFTLWNEGSGYDLPERRQLPDTRLHLLDGLTDASGEGIEVESSGITYENNVFTGFGGTNSLTALDATSLSNYASEFHFAAWLYPTSYGPGGVPGRFGRICSKGPTEFEIYMTDGSGQPSNALHVIVNGTGASLANVLSLNIWQHVAVSVVGTTASVYINGVLAGTVTVGTPTSASSNLGIGNRIDGAAADSRAFDGSLADIRFGHSALTADDAANLHRDGAPAIRGLEVLRIDPARYSGSGDLIDQTGEGNDAELQGTAAVAGGVLTTDGTTDSYARTSAANLGLDKGTIVARMRLGVSGDDTEGTSFFWDCVDARIALFRNGASRNEVRMFVNGRYRDFDPHEWDANTTYTVAMVYEKATDTLQLYWDGVAIAGEVPQGAWGSTALGTHFTIGSGFDGTGNLTAEYDWLNTYDEVLTADQLTFLSANGNADPFYEPPLVSNPSTGFSGILSARNTCKPRLSTGIRI